MLCLQPGLSSATDEGREMKCRKVKCAEERDCQLRIMALNCVRQCQAQCQCHSIEGVCDHSAATLPLAPGSSGVALLLTVKRGFSGRGGTCPKTCCKTGFHKIQLINPQQSQF